MEAHIAELTERLKKVENKNETVKQNPVVKQEVCIHMGCVCIHTYLVHQKPKPTKTPTRTTTANQLHKF